MESFNTRAYDSTAVSYNIFDPIYISMEVIAYQYQGQNGIQIYLEM